MQEVSSIEPLHPLLHTLRAFHLNIYSRTNPAVLSQKENRLTLSELSIR